VKWETSQPENEVDAERLVILTGAEVSIFGGIGWHW
jgi:hypothetical protein